VMGFYDTLGGHELAPIWKLVDKPFFTWLFVHTTSPRVGLGPGWARQVRYHTCQ
jgi:hypothetical protein